MLFGGINTFINSADQVVILWLGAQMVMDNTMTIGMYMAFNAYRGQFAQRAASLIDLTMQLKNAVAIPTSYVFLKLSTANRRQSRR